MKERESGGKDELDVFSPLSSKNESFDSKKKSFNSDGKQIKTEQEILKLDNQSNIKPEDEVGLQNSIYSEKLNKL
jgi:hypothetical protein